MSPFFNFIFATFPLLSSEKRVQLFLCLFFVQPSSLTPNCGHYGQLGNIKDTREPRQESINTQTNKRKAYANITAHTWAVKRQPPPPFPSSCSLMAEDETSDHWQTHKHCSPESQRANRLRHSWLRSLTHITTLLMLSGHPLNCLTLSTSTF